MKCKKKKIYKVVEWSWGVNPTNKKFISVNFAVRMPVGYTCAGFDLTRAENAILKLWGKSSEINGELLYGLLESFCDYGCMYNLYNSLNKRNPYL